MKKYSFNISLKNNTTSTINVNVLGFPSFPGFFNSKIKYTWDITGETYIGIQTVSIQMRRSDQTIYQVYTAILLSATPQSVVDALNSLNVGTFRTATSGLNTLIATNNDVYVYGGLSICNPASTFVYWAYDVNAGIFTLNVNAHNVVLAFSGSAPGSFSVNAGDTVDGSVVAGVIHTITITRSLKKPPFTTEIIFQVTGAGATPITPFIIDNNYTYNVHATT